MAIGVKLNVDVFFDRIGVIDRVEKKERKILSGTGAFGKRVIERSIRSGGKKKKSAKAGHPPRYHVRGQESLKDRIFFQYNYRSQSVDIGPQLFNAKGGGSQGSEVYKLLGASTNLELLNKGGARVVSGRGRGRHRVKYKKRIIKKYKPHPFVGEKSKTFKPIVDKMAQITERVKL